MCGRPRAHKCRKRGVSSCRCVRTCSVAGHARRDEGSCKSKFKVGISQNMSCFVIFLTLSSTDCDLLGASSASARAVGAVRGRRSPARHQLNLPLGRAITRHQCSLPQRVQLPGRPAGSCLLLAERRRRCPAQGVGGQLWLEDGGCFEAAAAQVWFRGCQHAARGPIPCLGRRVPVTCSSSRRVLTPW